MNLTLTLLAVFAILIFNEFWWRKLKIPNEFSRKFVHISVGCFVAFWPFYLAWGTIELLSVAFFVVVLLSKYLKLFRAIHSVQRPTWGELYFAASVGIIALLTHNKWIYAAALMQMALADGLAAIIGLRFGNRQNYLVFNHTKSVIGTITFFVTSVIILLVFNRFSNIVLAPLWIFIASLSASLLENIAVMGLDNLLVPLVVTILLLHH
jgi:phytol kinase